MLESNETQETVETPEGSTEKVAEGFSHLTKADLDPDYEPESETKEESVESDSPTKAEEKQVEYKINGTTYTDNDMGTRMVKDYENLTSFSGKQSEEIGKFKSEIDNLKTQIAGLEVENEAISVKEPEQEESAEKKADDLIFSKSKIEEMVNDKVKSILDHNAKKDAEKSAKSEFTSIAEKAGKEFIKNNPEYDDNSIIDLVNKATEKGVRFDTVNATEDSLLGYLNLIKMADTPNKPSSEKLNKPSNDTAEKLKEGAKVKANLSDTGSTDEHDGVNYDEMNPMEWAKLPDKKRQELLGVN